MRASVSPLLSAAQHHEAPSSKESAMAAVGPRPSQLLKTLNIYKDDAVEPLGNINIRRTLAGKLCGRGDDAAFNSKIIRFARQAEPFMTVLAALYAPGILSLCLIGDVTTRRAMGYATAASGGLVFVYLMSSLSWDMLCLLVRTFEFWFLFFINLSNNVFWNVMFHDARMAGIIATGCIFTVSLMFDANVYTRRFSTRGLLFGSPGLLVGLTLTAFHYPPDLHYETFTVFGIQIEAVDLLVNGTLIITYFSAIRVFRSRHLVFTQTPIRSIQCDMYYPECHLVLQSQGLVAEEATDVAAATMRRMTALGQLSALQRLKLLHASAAHNIDVTQVVWPRFALLVQRITPRHLLNVLGLLSHVTAVYSCGWIILSLISGDDDLVFEHRPPATVTVIISFACALVVVFVYAIHYQRQLVKRICLEPDAWFVSFQITVVTIGVCVLVQWEWRRVLPLLTMWLWCHWTIFLDAVAPPTRRLLGYSRVLPRMTILLLIAYPVALVYTLYLLPKGFRERDRVIFQLNLGGFHWKMKLLGFMSSKLFTFEVWMLRFFWRELLRRTDAFKLIKRRVFYQVPRTL